MFVRYKNINGDSDVELYEIEPEAINVKFFKTNRVYRYSYAKAGRTHVEKMKAFAAKGDGLNSYINLYCKYLYD